MITKYIVQFSRKEWTEHDKRFVPGVTTDLSLDYNDNDETDIANISFYSKDRGSIPLKGLCKTLSLQSLPIL